MKLVLSIREDVLDIKFGLEVWSKIECFSKFGFFSQSEKKIVKVIARTECLQLIANLKQVRMRMFCKNKKI